MDFPLPNHHVALHALVVHLPTLAGHDPTWDAHHRLRVYMCVYVCLSSSQPDLTYLHDINRRQSLAPQGLPGSPPPLPIPALTGMVYSQRSENHGGQEWLRGGRTDQAGAPPKRRFHDRYQLRPPIPPHHGLRGAANASHLVTIFGESNLIRISTDLVRTLPIYGPECKQGKIDTVVRSYGYAGSAS